MKYQESVNMMYVMEEYISLNMFLWSFYFSMIFALQFNPISESNRKQLARILKANSSLNSIDLHETRDDSLILYDVEQSSFNLFSIRDCFEWSQWRCDELAERNWTLYISQVMAAVSEIGKWDSDVANLIVSLACRRPPRH